MNLELTPLRIAMFWGKVDVRGPSECWLWLGTKKGTAGDDDAEYGRFFVGNGRTLAAHRVSFYIANGYFADPCTCHSCDNPPCVNPAHLFQGTNKENLQDCRRKGRNTHKLSYEQVVEIKGLLASGETKTSIGMKFGVDRKTIFLISKGTTFRDIRPGHLVGHGE